MTIEIVLVLYTLTSTARVQIFDTFEFSRDETTSAVRLPFVHERKLAAMPNRAPARTGAVGHAQRDCAPGKPLPAPGVAPGGLGGAMSVWLVSAAGIIVATISATVALLVPRVTP